jgi:DNA-binding transcriptional LysR family regulator
MTCLPELVAKLETAYPRLRIELTVINSTALSDMLMRKNLDLAFLTGPRQHRSIKVTPMGRTDVAWVSSAAKPVGHAVLRPRDMVDVPILSVTPPSPLHDLMIDWCTSDGSPPPSFSTCNNIAVIARLVLAGVAASVLPVCVVQRELEAGTLIRYAQNPPLAPRLMCAAYPATSGGPGMDAVLHIARDAFAHSRLFDPV